MVKTFFTRNKWFTERFFREPTIVLLFHYSKIPSLKNYFLKSNRIKKDFEMSLIPLEDTKSVFSRF